MLSLFSDAVPYLRQTGSSGSAPFVSGVVALMLAQDKVLTTTGVRSRLITTGRAPADGNIGVTIDPYQALSNGDFEAPLLFWENSGNATFLPRLGPIDPPSGDWMLAVSTGPDAEEVESSVTIEMDVPAEHLIDDRLVLRLRYNYVTEEYPEFVGSIFNDTFTIDVVLPDGSTLNMVDESVNTTFWTPVTGIDFPGGDDTVGQSGWQTASLVIPAASLDGGNSIEIVVRDVGDEIYDSVGLIDNIEVISVLVVSVP